MPDSLTNCRSLRKSLLEFLGSRVEVSSDEGACVVTLPIKTLDNRYVTVYVEPTATDRVLVHDGGDAASELFLQGVKLTDSKIQTMRAIAKLYGVSFANNSFTAVATPATFNEAVLSIAQCTSAGMYELLKHTPVFEEERVSTLVRKALERNPPANMSVQYGVIAKGALAGEEHRFDAVAFPLLRDLQTVAVKTLGTAYPAHMQKAAYGYLALDLKDTLYDKWPRIAVIARADLWPSEHLKTVRELSHETIELGQGDDQRVAERLLPLIHKLAA